MTKSDLISLAVFTAIFGAVYMTGVAFMIKTFD